MSEKNTSAGESTPPSSTPAATPAPTRPATLRAPIDYQERYAALIKVKREAGLTQTQAEEVAKAQIAHDKKLGV